MITIMILTNFNCYVPIVFVLYEFGNVKLFVELNIWREIWGPINILSLHYLPIALTTVASVLFL